MGELFEEPQPDKKQAAAQDVEGPVVGVAVAQNVWRTFDYIWPENFPPPQRGQRVRVPFGRGDRKTLAFVTDTLRRPSQRRLKAAAELIDKQSRFDETLWELGLWMSHYYLSPLGMTLAAMIPSAVGRHKPKTETIVYLDSHHKDWPAALGSRQRRVLDELYEARKQGVEPLTMDELRSHSGAGKDSINRLVRRKLIRTESRRVQLPRLTEAPDKDPFELNADQKAVMEQLKPRLEDGFSVTLLHGVTGSGKTEVYIRAIRRVVAAGKQAILMVPEIALATQTLQRLIRRLPRVAVLHSGLTDSRRAFYWDRIAAGEAAVIIGPRSAVFAPAPNLGLVVVDEEHEPSYKQDTAPRYHGRDVAIKRAALAGAPVVLGSATPSMESLHNARRGKYELARLPHRVRGLPMPKLKIVHLRKDQQPTRRIELIGATLTNQIARALDRREQVILLMNRRGYASCIMCPRCGWTMQCDNCTRAMVFHQATQLAMCHYCRHTASLPQRCPACKGKLLLFGLGIQRIEAELARKFPDASFARMDSDTMTSPKQFNRVFNAFATGKLDILLGTQMVAKGLDFPRVSLVGIVSADTSLTIPDFRASERTFQLVVQVAGRAGRADVPGTVIAQTLHPNEPAIRYAVAHDYDSFADWELNNRQQTGYPPASRMVRLVTRHRDAERAQKAAAKLSTEVRRMLHGEDVTIFGPQPAIIRKIRNQFRFDVQIISHRAGLVQELLAGRMEAIMHEVPTDVIADVDPVNLL